MGCCVREGVISSGLPPRHPLWLQKPPAVDSGLPSPPPLPGWPFALEHPAGTHLCTGQPPPASSSLQLPLPGQPHSREKASSVGLAWPRLSCAFHLSPVVQMVNFRKVPVPRPGLPALWSLSPGLAWPRGAKAARLSTHGGVSRRRTAAPRVVGVPRGRGGRQVRQRPPPPPGQPHRGLSSQEEEAAVAEGPRARKALPHGPPPPPAGWTTGRGRSIQPG